MTGNESADPNEGVTDPARRAVLQMAAVLAVAGTVVEAGAGAESDGSPAKAGDFDFLAGHWSIAHRRLKGGTKDDWDVFDGEASCWTILAGAASIEELRIPARSFSGIGIRLLEVKQRSWSDYWVNARDGLLSTPGTTGRFKNGVGTFIANDSHEGRPIKVRGVWDRITPTSCRWHQASSRDGGLTWHPDWFMDWTRKTP